MNYLTLILLVMLCFVIVEMLCGRYDKVCKQVYDLAFVTLVVMVGAKYMLGPDVANYFPHYNTLPHLDSLFSQLGYLQFEPGFNLYCSVLKTMGVSFWGMTLMVTLIYYAAVYLLFRRLTAHRTLALFALILLDYNLVLYEYRQCLAVAFFIFAYLLLEKRRYVAGAVCVLVCVLMHKSSVFVCMATVLFMMFWQFELDKKAYITLALLLCSMLVLPMSSLGDVVVRSLPLNDTIKDSLSLHLAMGSKVQIVFPIYFLAIVCLAYYSNFAEKDKRWHWMMWLCVAAIVTLYQYWFLLNRLRSFVLPFLLVYMQSEMAQSERKKDHLPAQLFAVVFMLYAAVFTYSSNQTPSYAKSKTNRVSTVFELNKHSQVELQERQMKEAILFWEHDFVYTQKEEAK
ncbi:MAG: EpsG family protein [Paludibacteraceae bacterium]|nr:EpsG family protein [Paludibacteraceae bacterium]